MRTEATLEEWKKLYEAASRIKELEPWAYLWDMDIIGVRVGEDRQNTVFYSILGRGGDCYGIVAYEGYEAFNTFLMLTMQERLNLSIEYAMSHQSNLTCYWGNREELSDKQRKIIKDLGYKYRGKNQWLYFMSYEPGYYPYITDRDEVLRMTEHLEDLELALHNYKSKDIKVNFSDANMFSLAFSEDKKTWRFSEEPLPFTSFQFGNLIITDEKLLEDLAKVPRSKVVLEADIAVMGASVKDKAYKKPAYPEGCLLVEAVSGMILTCEIQEPEDDAKVALADAVIHFIFTYGAPKEIRVSNIIIESVLEHICDKCQIKLRRVKRLAGIEDFLQLMRMRR